MATRSPRLAASYTFAVSGSSAKLAVAGRNVVVVDLKSRKRLYTTHPLSHSSELAFSPNDDVLAVKNTLGEIALLSTREGTVLTRFKPKQREEGANILFSSCGTFLIDANWDGVIRVRNAANLSLESEYAFPGEMVREVSASSDRMTWLFSHQMTMPHGQSGNPPRPQISIWKWPLTKPSHWIETGFDGHRGVALSPCATYVACTGFVRGSRTDSLRLMTVAGTVIADAPFAFRGASVRTRWAPNSLLLGTVNRDGFQFFHVPSMTSRKCIGMRYASDLAFFDTGGEVVLGSWEKGEFVSLGINDA